MEVTKLKEELGSRAYDIIASDLGLDVNGRQCHCPFPDHEDDKPSATWYENSNMIYCHKCSKGYDIFEHLATHRKLSFDDSLNFVRKELGLDEITEDSGLEEVYRLDFKKKTNDINKILDILDTRGLNGRVMNYVDILLNDDELSIVYKDIDSKTIAIDNLSTGFRGSDEALLNVDNVKNNKRLYITFDTFDLFTLLNIGYDNAVAPLKDDTTFLMKYIEFIDEFDEIILVHTDKLDYRVVENLIKRVGINKVFLAYVGDYNSVNEAYMLEGREYIDQVIEEARKSEVPGLKRLEDIPFEHNQMKEVIRFGQEQEALSSLDYRLDGMREGKLTSFLGRNNEGKTTFVQQIIANVIEGGNGVFVYDGESNPSDFKRKFYQKMIGDNPEYTKKVKINIREMTYPKDDIKKALELWHKDKLIIKTHDDIDIGHHDNIFDLMHKSYKLYNTKVYIIDNLMSVLTTNSNNKYSDQSTFVEKLKKFAVQHKAHVILLVHPNKEAGEGNLLKKLNISGDNDIANKSDNIISIARVFENQNRGTEDNPKYENVYGGNKYPFNNRIDCIIEILKNRDLGEFGKYFFTYRKETDSFEEIYLDRKYQSKELYKRNTYSWKKFMNVKDNVM